MFWRRKKARPEPPEHKRPVEGWELARVEETVKRLEKTVLALNERLIRLEHAHVPFADEIDDINSDTDAPPRVDFTPPAVARNATMDAAWRWSEDIYVGGSWKPGANRMGSFVGRIRNVHDPSNKDGKFRFESIYQDTDGKPAPLYSPEYRSLGEARDAVKDVVRRRWEAKREIKRMRDAKLNPKYPHAHELENM